MNRELILRLTKYKRLLHKLKALGLERVFSNNLGDAIGVSPALVRKDFSNLSLPGNKRGGYNIDELTERLDGVLGYDENQNVIIVGCGRIGTALMRFDEFHHEGIRIKAGFDASPEHVDNTTEIPVYPMDQLPAFVKEHGIRVGIIAVPDNAASQVFEMMVHAGIHGILNFAAVELKCAPGEKNCAADCTVHNVNIGLEIEHLFYQLNLSDTGAGCREE
jgi:redox-sensing transcriptional repressor